MITSPRSPRISLVLTLLLACTHVAAAQTPLPVWGVPVAVETGYTATAKFNTPYAVAVDSQGNVVVVDELHQMVEVLLANGNVLTYGATGAEYPQGSGACGMSSPSPDSQPAPPPPDPLPFNAGCFSDPRGVAIDSSDLIYVSDWANNSVVVFDSASHTVAAGATQLLPLARFGTTGGADWSTSGGAPGQLEAPIALAIDRGPRYNNTATVNRVFVLDQFNDRIQSWDCDASMLQDPTKAASGCTLTALQIGAPDPTTASGHTPGYFDYPWGFGVDQTTGDIAVAETSDSLVDVYRYPFTGNSLWGYATSIATPNILQPEDVKFHPGSSSASDLWVTDYGNNRIVVFQQNGSSTPTLRYQPLTGIGLRYQPQDPGDSPVLTMVGPQSLEFNPNNNHVIVVDQGGNVPPGDVFGNGRLQEWAQVGLTVSTTLPSNLFVGSAIATVTVTNSGTVRLDNVVPSFNVSTAVGVAVDPTGGLWPPAAVSLGPGGSTTFQLPLSIQLFGAVSFQTSASAVHSFSGAVITATAPTVNGTSTAAPNPKLTSSATITPTPKVFHGAAICVTVVANNGGNTQLDNPTLVITPMNATATPAASAPASCKPTALASTSSLAVPPGASSKYTWTEPFTAGSSGTASFTVRVSATVHGSSPSQVINALDTSVQTDISADVTNPTISITVAPKYPGVGVETAANAAGWWNTPLLAKFHATDDTALGQICYTVLPAADTGGAQCIDVTQPANAALCNASRTTCDAQVTLDLGARYAISCSATDSAGNTFSPAATQVNLDLAPPTVNFTNPTPAANAHGWNNTAVTWNIVQTDDLSGVASVTFGGVALAKPQLTVNQQGYGVQAIVVITDGAGNVTEAQSPALNIDFIPPTMTPLVTGNVVTFPPMSSSFPNGQTDPAPPAVTPPAGITVAAFKASDIDPATAPPVAGLPADGPQHTWTLCDNAGNCNTIGFGAELVNAFDLTLKTDAMYTRYGSTGYLPTPLAGVCLGGVKHDDHDHDRDHDRDRGRDHDADDDDGDCRLGTVYKVVDANGNGIYMLEHIQQSEGTEVHVDVLSFSYVSGCPTACAVKPGVVPRGTSKDFEWSVDRKTGKLTVLDQSMSIGDGDNDADDLRVTAHYDSKKNTTTVQRTGRNGFKKTLTGLVLLDMATLKGALVIEYNGTVVTK